MKSYTVTIKFLTDYLQARFSENAKEELENYISRGIVKSKEDSWAVFLFQDEKGIYIPSLQIRNALKNAGKEFKMKKKRSSMKQWVISNIVIDPEKIYLEGKERPDSILVSFPLRKDGSRVVIKHPVFTAGLEVTFTIRSLDDDMEDKAIKDLIDEAGKTYGIGARRADTYGRFEVLTFKVE